MKTLKMRLKTVVAVCFIVGLCAACSSPEDARRALTGAGYSNIETHGYDFFACGQDDFYHTKFSATNPQGKRVDGVVCSGLLFKSATIRF